MNKVQKNDSLFFKIDFFKASPEAIDSILNALNSEVDEAIQDNRIPVLDGAFRRLCPTLKTMIIM